MNSVATLFFVLAVLLLLSVPIAVSVGFSSAIMVFQTNVPPEVIVQRMFTSIDSFPLLAIPFFILAGNLMERGGISKRLIELANSFLGARTGGLGMVTILSSMFFSSISGSGPATTAAIGSIMIPSMVKKGYDIRFASATQAAAGELGVIIPPSITMVLFGIAAGVSIGDLFIAGIIPGLLIGFSLMLVMYVVAKKRGYSGGERSTWKERLTALQHAILPLLMPLIILGGIYGGIFTPTEAAVVASVYALILGVLIYRELKWKDLWHVFYKSAIMSAVILVIISAAGLFGWILTSNGVPQMVAQFFAGISDNPIIFLLLINLLLFIIGMFFDAGAAIIILAPILTPIAMSLGIDPVHFGVIMIVNLAMGMITPPIGVNLFVVCQIANISLESLIRPLIWYLAVVIVDILIISYVPELSLWLPQLLR